MRKTIFVLAALAILFSGGALKAANDDPKIVLTGAEVKILLADASRLSGLTYDTSRPLPPIVMMPKATFDKVICGDKAKTCTVRAAYIDAYNMILVGTEDLNTLEFKAVIIHELVHYLAQMPSNVYATVEGCVMEEGRAYSAQRAYLKEHKGDDSRIMSPAEVHLICIARFGGY